MEHSGVTVVVIKNVVVTEIGSVTVKLQWTLGVAISAIAMGIWVAPTHQTSHIHKSTRLTPDARTALQLDKAAIGTPKLVRSRAIADASLAILDDETLLAQKNGGDSDTRPDSSRSGRLRLDGSTLIANGSLASSYEISLSQQGRVTVELKSDEFDAYLRLLDSEGNLIAENDDRSDFNFNSRLDESLDAGTYTILVSTYGVLQQGRYDIGVTGQAEIAETTFPSPSDSSLIPLDIPQTIASLSDSRAAVSAEGTSYRSVVQLYVGQGSGSGTLLTDDGLLLTNYHVLTESDGTTLTEEPIFIGVATEPDRAVTPLFRGTIERSAEAEDLALVQITSDLLGNPIPDDMNFDTVPLGDADDVGLGDRVVILGFPGTTSIQAGGASYLTLTEGVIGAILPRNGRRHDFITDATVNAGNSGGAALNADGELIGVPSSNVSDTSVGPGDFDTASVLRAVTAMPDEWRSLIR